MIEKHDCAVLKVFDHEIDSVDVAGNFDKHLILQRFKHKISLVELLLLGRHHWFNLYFRIILGIYHLRFCMTEWNWRKIKRFCDFIWASWWTLLIKLLLSSLCTCFDVKCH